jgi:hypothetical protein
MEFLALQRWITRKFLKIFFFTIYLHTKNENYFVIFLNIIYNRLCSRCKLEVDCHRKWWFNYNLVFKFEWQLQNKHKLKYWNFQSLKSSLRAMFAHSSRIFSTISNSHIMFSKKLKKYSIIEFLSVFHQISNIA